MGVPREVYFSHLGTLVILHVFCAKTIDKSAIYMECGS